MASAAETEVAALNECRRLVTKGALYQRRRCKCRRDRLVEVSPEDPVAFYRGCCWAAADTPSEARAECQRRIERHWCEPSDADAVHVATGPYVRKAPFRQFEGEAHRYLVASDTEYPDWVGIDGEPPCFPAGTAVALERGPTPIEDVEIDDRVLTIVDGQSRYAPVLSIHTRHAAALVVIDLGDKALRATAEHPIWLEDAWRPARDAGIGDRLRTIDGEAYVRGIELESGDVEVWSLRVGAPHSYFAGGVWVHNY